jgi:cell division protein YceG involved in septum cleavage
VIENRLREGIPLGIDATIRFATNNWTRPLTQSQLAIDSPYNTRTRRGLPPGPIGSPGLAAIRAAAKPARTGFLFYVVKPGTCGEHDFSKTDAEFQRDVARYNAERERRGGKSPTNC